MREPKKKRFPLKKRHEMVVGVRHLALGSIGCFLGQVLGGRLGKPPCELKCG